MRNWTKQFCVLAQGRVLGIRDSFLPEVVDVAIGLSHGCDAEVAKNADRIRREVAREEDR